MLVLPLRQRNNSSNADTEEASSAKKGGSEQTSWASPQTVSTHVGGTLTTTSSATVADSSSSNSDGLKLTVKNTFIELETPESLRLELPRGAQSCTARLNEPMHSFGQSPAIPEALPEEEEDDEEDTLRNPSIARALDFDAVDAELDERPGAGFACLGQVAMPMQLPPPRPHASSAATASPLSISQSCAGHQRVVGSGAGSPGSPDLAGDLTGEARADRFAGTPQRPPAPPTYAAPVVFQSEPMSPPPAAPPGIKEEPMSLPAGLRGPTCSQGQSQGLPPVWDTATRSTTSPATTGSSTGRTPARLSDFAEDHRFVVKNTFIDYPQDSPRLAALDKYSLSCTARLSAGPAQFHTITPTGAMAGSLGQSLSWTQAQKEEAAQAAVPSSAPSAGSEKHGTLDPDGLSACQPCAWFYKESGCLNGQDCRYCHLCPFGELKSRKKQKIQRLRAQDAAAAEAGTPPPGGIRVAGLVSLSMLP